jgi:hypothetical protein
MAKSVAEHHVRLVAETAQYETQMKSAAGASRALAVEQGKAAAASQTGSKAASRFGVVSQQAGYQVQDFAVQVAGGQNAMVAFSQQASQMLGFFGPAGAMAGAVLAVGVLAARVLDVSKNTTKAGEKLDEMARAYKELADARKEAFLARSDASTNQTSIENDIERMRKTEEGLNAERERGIRLLDEATKMERLDRKIIFPSADARKQYEDALKTRGNVTAAEFGGQSFTGRSLGDYGESLIESSAKALAEIEVARIAAEEKLREIKEKNFEQDRRNENELMGINVKRIGAEITAEFKKSEQIEKLAEFRDKKQEERVNNALQSFFSDIGRGNLDKTIMGLQNRLPQALQINTGASALGGVTGGGVASQTLDIQKQILDGIRALVRMEQMASSGYN